MKCETFITKVCDKQCLDHKFLFKPMNDQCWNKQELDISYCPQHNNLTKISQNIVPIFNNDNNECLPAFILQVDKHNYQANLKRYQDEHRLKALEYAAKKKELINSLRSQQNQPRPNRKHRQCALCHKEYDDYKEHIASRDHKEKFSHNKYVIKIEKLSKDFQSKSTQEDLWQISIKITLCKTKLISSQISDQMTSMSKYQTQSTQQLLQKQVKFAEIQLPMKRGRGRPTLTEEEKRKRALERERLRQSGLQITKKIHKEPLMKPLQPMRVQQPISYYPSYLVQTIQEKRQNINITVNGNLHVSEIPDNDFEIEEEEEEEQ